MPYSVTYLEDLGAIETVYTGALAPGELDQAITATGTLAAENLCNRFLVDCRDMAPGGSTLDIWALAEFLASLPLGIIEREAILLPATERGAEDMTFFETAARNRGLNVRAFEARQDAIAWLAE